MDRVFCMCVACGCGLYVACDGEWGGGETVKISSGWKKEEA